MIVGRLLLTVTRGGEKAQRTTQMENDEVPCEKLPRERVQTNKHEAKFKGGAAMTRIKRRLLINLILQKLGGGVRAMVRAAAKNS